MNKSFREEMSEIRQWWFFYVKHREKRGWWFDFLAWVVRRLEK